MEDTKNPYQAPDNDDPLRDAIQYREHFEDEEEFQDALAIWPVCPECGRRRITRCPICKVAGTLFPLADSDFWFDEVPAPQAAQSQQAAGHSCHCGSSCKCHSQDDPASSNTLPPIGDLAAYMPGKITKESEASETEGSSDAEPNSSNTVPSMLQGEMVPGIPDPRRPQYLVQENESSSSLISITNDQFARSILDGLKEEETNSPKAQKQKELKLVTCYVCSEPFEPKFPSRCEWCGHQFEQEEKENDSDTPVDSLEHSSSEDTISISHDDTVSPVMLLVFLILGLLFLAAMGYLWLLFREPPVQNGAADSIRTICLNYLSR